ncbi:MAG: cation-translocating P-type ATPase, partial [Betaproteobacteria bacterium]|nr:cation-translocating P-type ATPase [Betaproteobacteria bacterium]
LEAGATHPIARALKGYRVRQGIDGDALHVASLKIDSGAGVAGIIDGVDFRLGKAPYVMPLVGHPGPSAAIADATLFLGKTGQWLAAISISDAIKPDAANSISQLRKAGLSPHILSGDREDRVAAVATSLSVSAQSVRAELLPQQKLDYAQSLQSHSRIWIAVGDGINDAPLMGAASVSIAIGSGADLTRLTADAVLLSPHLSPLVTAREIATRMHRVIRQNFAWAIAYNLIAIPFAVAGFISPAWAAIGMASSSLIVVANSLRLIRRRSSTESTAWKS